MINKTVTKNLIVKIVIMLLSFILSECYANDISRFKAQADLKVQTYAVQSESQPLNATTPQVFKNPENHYSRRCIDFYFILDATSQSNTMASAGKKNPCHTYYPRTGE